MITVAEANDLTIYGTFPFTSKLTIPAKFWSVAYSDNSSRRPDPECVMITRRPTGHTTALGTVLAVVSLRGTVTRLTCMTGFSCPGRQASDRRSHPRASECFEDEQDKTGQDTPDPPMPAA